MKLLFDANVSHKLVRALASDERSYVEGFPPKIIWLDVGNAGTVAIATLLRSELERIERFAIVEETSVLILSIGTNAV